MQCGVLVRAMPSNSRDVSAPTGPLVVAKEDTLNSGEVSRDLVADVCVAAVFDAKASNKVVEIIEKDGSPPAPVGANIFAGV